MKIILIPILLCCATAQAESYGLHLGSYHTEAGHNNINPGAYVRTSSDTWQAGAYYNSLSRATVYGMGNVSALGVTASLGVATGYKKPIVPMVALSYRVDHWRLSYVPKFSDLNKGHVLHLSYEF